MGYPDTDRTARGQLRLIYSDRVVSRYLGTNPTLGDVAEALSELGPRCYGHPVAIDVTMADLSERHSASRFDDVRRLAS
jgi:hypothetical protein